MDTEHQSGGLHEVTPQDVAVAADLLEGHAERVASYEKTKRAEKPTGSPHGVKVRRRDQRPEKPMRELTGRQRHKRYAALAAMDLQRRVNESPINDGRIRSRQSWCALLRDLELHPDQVERIKAKMAKQTAKVIPILDEITAATA